jgi:hypothetical protein
LIMAQRTPGKHGIRRVPAKRTNHTKSSDFPKVAGSASDPTFGARLAGTRRYFKTLEQYLQGATPFSAARHAGCGSSSLRFPLFKGLKVR